MVGVGCGGLLGAAYTREGSKPLINPYPVMLYIYGSKIAADVVPNNPTLSLVINPLSLDTKKGPVVNRAGWLIKDVVQLCRVHHLLSVRNEFCGQGCPVIERPLSLVFRKHAKLI